MPETVSASLCPSSSRAARIRCRLRIAQSACHAFPRSFTMRATESARRPSRFDRHEVVAQAMQPPRSESTSRGESDHEMEIRVCDGAHGSVRGRSSVGSDNARKGAHAGLAGKHAPKQSTRNLARLAAAALDASARDSCPAPGTDGHAGESSITDGPRADGTVPSWHPEPAVHPGGGLVAHGEGAAGPSWDAAASRAEMRRCSSRT